MSAALPAWFSQRDHQPAFDGKDKNWSAQEDIIMNPKLKDMNVDYLFKAILSLKNEEESV